MKPHKALHQHEESLMPRIGLRAFKIRASEVTRDVQENRAHYTITNRGEPVAILIPYSPEKEAIPAEGRRALNELESLRQVIAQSGRAPFAVEDLMHEMRR
jgi:prevent-host-death family protein